MTYRRASVEFQDAKQPGLVHVTYAEADDYAELVARAESGYRWLDPTTGTFHRSRPKGRSLPTGRRPTRDYIEEEEKTEWRL